MRPKRPHAAFGHHHRPVSWTPSKIPYGGFSPVRLQATAFQRVPSDLSFEPSFADFGYAVLFLPCPWAFARLIAGRPSPSVIGRRSPRALRSAGVLLSLGILATTARSASLARPADFTGCLSLYRGPFCVRPSQLSLPILLSVPPSLRRWAEPGPSRYVLDPCQASPYL
jgi:hypothetical protein